LKNFWCGPGGWRDRQSPDVTVLSTGPTGHPYTTLPGRKVLFPSLCTPTATLWASQPPTIEAVGGRGVMMPRRRPTREPDTAERNAAGRRLNDTHAAERNKPPPF
jgi:hypothetical protein